MSSAENWYQSSFRKKVVSSLEHSGRNTTASSYWGRIPTGASSVSFALTPQAQLWQNLRRKLGYKEVDDSLQVRQMRSLVRNVPRYQLNLVLLAWLWRGQKMGRCWSPRSWHEYRSHPVFGYEMSSIDIITLLSYIPITMFVQIIQVLWLFLYHNVAFL